MVELSTVTPQRRRTPAATAAAAQGDPMRVTQERLTRGVANYVRMLVKAHPFSKDIIVDERRMYGRIKANWPDTPGWEDESHHLLHWIVDTLHQSLREQDIIGTMPQALVRIEVADKPLAPQSLPDPHKITIIISFGAARGVVRHCVVPATEEEPPPLDKMAVPAGILVEYQFQSPPVARFVDNQPLYFAGGPSVYITPRNRDEIISGYDAIGAIGIPYPESLLGPGTANELHDAYREIYPWDTRLNQSYFPDQTDSSEATEEVELAAEALTLERLEPGAFEALETRAKQAEETLRGRAEQAAETVGGRQEEAARVAEEGSVDNAEAAKRATERQESGVEAAVVAAETREAAATTEAEGLGGETLARDVAELEAVAAEGPRRPETAETPAAEAAAGEEATIAEEATVAEAVATGETLAATEETAEPETRAGVALEAAQEALVEGTVATGAGAVGEAASEAGIEEGLAVGVAEDLQTGTAEGAPAEEAAPQEAAINAAEEITTTGEETAAQAGVEPPAAEAAAAGEPAGAEPPTAGAEAAGAPAEVAGAEPQQAGEIAARTEPEGEVPGAEAVGPQQQRDFPDSEHETAQQAAVREQAEATAGPAGTEEPPQETHEEEHHVESHFEKRAKEEMKKQAEEGIKPEGPGTSETTESTETRETEEGKGGEGERGRGGDGGQAAGGGGGEGIDEEADVESDTSQLAAASASGATAPAVAIHGHGLAHHMMEHAMLEGAGLGAAGFYAPAPATHASAFMAAPAATLAPHGVAHIAAAAPAATIPPPRGITRAVAAHTAAPRAERKSRTRQVLRKALKSKPPRAAAEVKVAQKKAEAALQQVPTLEKG